jgi:hypothetical protein
MAKRLRFNYTFTPSTNTIVIDGILSAKRLLLITNTRTNTIIYNFSDASRTYQSISYSNTTNQTTIVLTYNCSSMLSSDNLQIFTEEDSVVITPSEVLQDPVNKLRTSQPQALIDTDFEYGTQITKWENLAMINNRPFSFPSAVGLGTINYINLPPGSRLATVGLVNGAPGIGSAVTVQDAYLAIANGNFLVESVSGTGNTIFTYTAKATNSGTVTNIVDPSKTGIFSGTVYTGARLGGLAGIVTVGVVTMYSPTTGPVGAALTITTSVPHGLVVGNPFAIANATAGTANPPNGSFVVTTVNNSTSFVGYTTYTAPVGLIQNASVYVRPSGQSLHRPFDGGVIFSNYGQSNYETFTRQTRRYFRYQSGKGIQVSSGSILKPNFSIDSITSSGTTVTVRTKEAHNIQAGNPGATITVSGCNETGYNGTFTVTTVTGSNTFQYTALTTPATTTATGLYNVSVSNWYGSSSRLGIFDQQNGLFFEFDGQTLYAVRRSSTFQIAGRVSVGSSSNTMTQTDSAFPTQFTKQLNIGDQFVVRGQSYRVIDIASDTSLTFVPSYRATSADYVTASLTQDLRIPQSQWNLDKCDGTGPSGYNIDLSKMQMFYIDYSWYGAGFIRWGFRGPNGDVIYVHKIANNNVNTEAYMRSGNLPARYESEARPPYTNLRRTLTAGDTTIGVGSTGGFPSQGTILLYDANVFEYMNYTGVTTDGFTGLTRGQVGTAFTGLSVTGLNANINTGTASTTGLQIGMRAIAPQLPENTYVSSVGIGIVTFSQAATATCSTVVIPPMGLTNQGTITYTSTNPIGIQLAYPSFAPTISHWGTSVIMDGRFDDDKSLVFTYGQSTSTAINPGVSRALFSIRVAPSVDNGIAAGFGARELINRMQLTLKTLDITSASLNPNLLVRAYLNAVPSTATLWTNAVSNVAGVLNSSLSQIADYAGGSSTVAGGEVTAGFFVGSGANSIDLSNVRDLGNSILGGGGAAANTQIYPDGPDTLTIVVTNLSTLPTAVGVATVFGRLSWTEAQA